MGDKRYIQFTVHLTETERDDIEELARMLETNRPEAVRAAVRVTLKRLRDKETRDAAKANGGGGPEQR